MTDDSFVGRDPNAPVTRRECVMMREVCQAGAWNRLDSLHKQSEAILEGQKEIRAEQKELRTEQTAMRSDIKQLSVDVKELQTLERERTGRKERLERWRDKTGDETTRQLVWFVVRRALPWVVGILLGGGAVVGSGKVGIIDPPQQP